MDLETGLPQSAIGSTSIHRAVAHSELESESESEINEELAELLNELDRKMDAHWHALRERNWKACDNEAIRDLEKCYIYKFNGPEDIQKVRVVAIGPYHHERQVKGELLVTTHMKWQIVALMEKVLGFDRKSYLTTIKKRERDLWFSYEEDEIKMDPNCFVEMLMLDGCFILFLFVIRSIMGKKYDSQLSIGISPFGNSIMEKLVRIFKEIKLDLLMCNNQIPFELISGDISKIIIIGYRSAQECAIKCFDDIYPPIDPQYWKTIDEKTFHHLLHLFHWSRTASTKYQESFDPLSIAGAIPSASELQGSGISVHIQGSNHRAPDITLSHGFWGAFKLKGIMNVPKLHITDYTKYILHTLVTFEQQMDNRIFKLGYCFTSYVASMEHLVQNENDVKLLRKRGVLANTSKTNKEVVEIIQGLNLNQLSVEMQPMRFFRLTGDVSQMFARVRRHYGRKWNMRYGELEQTYCGNVWITLSVVAAILLFFFTGLQSAYAVASYHFPKN